MTNARIITSPREEIPIKYLTELFVLMQNNHEEIRFYEAPKIDFYKKSWIIGTSVCKKTIWSIVMNSSDKVIGYGYFSWNIKYDNLDSGYFWIHVTKEERRKGVGTSILKELVQQIPNQITTIVTDIFEKTDGIPFIQTLKTEKSYQNIKSSSNLSEFNPEQVKEEAKKQKSKALENGYEMIFIENMDHILHVHLPQYIKMVEEIWNDMPLEELSYEKEVVTIERYQEMLQREHLLGNKHFTYALIHKETNSPVGLTSTLIYNALPSIAYQKDTGVLKPHRGHGLGLALKYQMLDKLLSETQAKHWTTGNAGSNEHMLKINRILKYKPVAKVDLYEFKKDELQKKLLYFIIAN